MKPNLNLMKPLKNLDWARAATAIKTTDTFTKVSKRVCKIDETEIEIVGIAKGSGMITPSSAKRAHQPCARAR